MMKHEKWQLTECESDSGLNSVSRLGMQSSLKLLNQRHCFKIKIF